MNNNNYPHGLLGTFVPPSTATSSYADQLEASSFSAKKCSQDCDESGFTVKRCDGGSGAKGLQVDGCREVGCRRVGPGDDPGCGGVINCKNVTVDSPGPDGPFGNPECPNGGLKLF